jgi:hypothetical protein
MSRRSTLVAGIGRYLDWIRQQADARDYFLAKRRMFFGAKASFIA